MEFLQQVILTLLCLAQLTLIPNATSAFLKNMPTLSTVISSWNNFLSYAMIHHQSVYMQELQKADI